MLPARFTDFLPHDDSVVLLEKVVEHSESHIVCSAKLGTPRIPGFCDAKISPLIGLEYIAQTIAAYEVAMSGLANTEARSQSQKIGVIAAVRELSMLCSAFTPDQEIFIRAERDFLSTSVANFRGVILDANTNRPLFSATVTLVLTEQTLMRRPATTYA